MAYIPQQLPQEEQNKFGSTNPTTPLPPPSQSSGSAGSTGGGGSGVKQAPGVGSSTQFGSNASKLSDYLNANKDQVTGYGQQVAGDLTNRFNQTKSDINSGFGQFGQQVQGNYAPPDQSKLNQALTNPTDFVKDQKNVSDFQSWYNPEYKGPSNFEGSSTYSNLNNEVNNAVQNAGLVGTQSGLGTYLNNNLGAKDYTQGMQTLDTALLQRNPESNQAIQEAAKPYSNLSGYLGDTTSQANQKIADVKNQVNQSGQNVRQQTGDVANQFSNDLNSRVSSMRNDATARENAVKSTLTPDFASYNPNQSTIDPRVLSDLGIQDPTKISQLLSEAKAVSQGYSPKYDTTKTLQPIAGTPVDLTQYGTFGNPETSINPNTVASADDYSRYAALSQLMGQSPTLLDPSLAGQAGTANADLSSFDLQGAQQALNPQMNALLDLIKKDETQNRNPVIPPHVNIGSSPFVGVF